MFREFPRPLSGAQWLQWQPLILPSYRGDSRAVFVVGPARPRTQHGYNHYTKLKPEATTAVIELLMMGERTPGTCWAVNKRQDNKLENCCIWLVIYFNSFSVRIFFPCDSNICISHGFRKKAVTYIYTYKSFKILHNNTFYYNFLFSVSFHASEEHFPLYLISEGLVRQSGRLKTRCVIYTPGVSESSALIMSFI